jgi:hypothetical protein
VFVVFQMSPPSGDPAIRAMLIAVVDVRGVPIELTATLGPLVRGVVEGLVGTAMLVARDRNEDIAAIADAAGCRILVAETWAEGFARAVTNAPGVGMLLVDAGLQLGPDFWPLLTDKLPLLGNRPAATEPAARAGLAAPLRALTHAFNRATGRVTRDSALLLPPSRARELAQAKADPFAQNYGAALVRLNASVTRVDLR